MRLRMKTESELCVNKLCKSVGISSTGNFYGTACFKLDFKVERSLEHHKVLQDTIGGTVLQVIVKEARKEEDDTEHNMDVIMVSRSATTNFDMSTLAGKCKNSNNSSCSGSSFVN
jgi:hypothetical protein